MCGDVRHELSFLFCESSPQQLGGNGEGTINGTKLDVNPLKRPTIHVD